ncbi:hypothetical protein V2J09_002885 [Rumex salicifolius]
MAKQNSLCSLFVLLPLIFLQANAVDSDRPSNPLPLLPLRIKPNQTASSCTYTVAITTSCSSPSYTRDLVSLSFGDAYGNQVNVPRLDDPSAGTFERCSTDTFQIYGPCTYDVCYAYLLRRGHDGWKVGSVQIYGTYTRTVTFTYNDFLPNNVWWGFNYCSGAFAASTTM